MKKNNLKTATKILEAFKAAGYTAEINEGMFGYRYQTRYYWFTILFDGSLLFNHCYSQNTAKVTKDYDTRRAADKRVETVSGVAFLEVVE